jgi:hypothetical protein
MGYIGKRPVGIFLSIRHIFEKHQMGYILKRTNEIHFKSIKTFGSN